MQMARPARRAGIESRSASDVTITVSVPSIWHARITRTAISPRLAIRTRRIVMSLVQFSSGRAHAEQDLPVFDQLGVFCADFRDHAFDPGRHCVEGLHDFDEA